MHTVGDRLEELQIGYCTSISDVGVIQIAWQCPNLRVLNVYGCGELTDEALAALGVGCERLEVVDLSLCRSDRCAHPLQIAHLCTPALQRLTLTFPLAP